VTWEIAPGEAERLAALSPADRYRLFLQLAADGEEVWGLEDDEGWIVQRRESGNALPLWPHPECAALCARGPWEGTRAAVVDIDELLAELLPLLVEDGMEVAVFPAPGDDGSRVAPERLQEDLEEELRLAE
jgi:hypothetical protein